MDNMNNEMENIRLQLLQLAKKKEIPYTQAKIRKMDYAELDQIFSEYKAKELDNINETFADIIIVKFDELMENYKFIKQDSKLAQKLQDRKLFKADVKSVVSYFTPLLPFLGLIEGGAVVVSEMMDARANKRSECSSSDENKNGNDTCQAEERCEQNTTATEPDQHDNDVQD